MTDILAPVNRAFRLAGLAALAVVLAGPARAADDATFYAGKQITVIVPSEASGAYNGYSRLLVRHWGKYIPGNPSFIVQNMPGGGGLTAANHLGNRAARDGTVVGAFFASAPSTPLVSPDAALYDGNTLSWIGSITTDPFVGYVWHTSPFKALAEAKTREVIMGGPQGVGTAGVDYAILAKEMAGLKLKIVAGYPGSGDVKLAMERGEVHGTFANGYASLKSSEPAWLTDKKIVIFVQHGLTRHRDLPDVPLLIDQVSDPLDRQALEFMLARQEFARPFATPPDVPAARVEMLRRAFDAVMKDPNFLAEAAKANLPVDGPLTGEQVAVLVKRVTATPKAAVDRIQDLFDKFRAGVAK